MRRAKVGSLVREPKLGVPTRKAFRKGPGYQVQISQAYDTGEEGPGLIVSCLPQSAAESDSAALESVYEQQQRMETLPDTLLADTAYGSQSHVEMSAELGVNLVSPAGGHVEKSARPTANPSPREPTLDPERPITVAEQKKAALNQRRVEQETPEWKKGWTIRSILPHPLASIRIRSTDLNSYPGGICRHCRNPWTQRHHFHLSFSPARRIRGRRPHAPRTI